MLKYIVIGLIASGMVICFLSCKEDEYSKIAAIEIHYIDRQIATIQPLICSDVKTFPSVEHMVIIDEEIISRFTEKAKDMKLDSNSTVSMIDARICCDLMDNSGNLIKQLAIGSTDVMQVDGSVYNLDNAIIEEINNLIPETNSSSDKE